MPGSPNLEQSDLYLLHDALATWLTDNTPYFASNPLPDHKGLPMAAINNGSYELDIPGTIVRQLTPQAAKVLCVEQSDHVEAAYLPPQYLLEAPGEEPQYRSPAASIMLIDETGRTHAHYYNELHDLVISWQARTPRNISDHLGRVELRACLEIAQNLPAYHTEMRQKRVLPEDLLTYRQERDIATKAAKLAKIAEHDMRRANEERLAKAPTNSRLDEGMAHQIRYQFSKNAFAYAGRSQIEQLRQSVAETMISHDISVHVFSDELAAKISPAFHNRHALKTIVKGISLVTRASEYGPVFSFILTKDVLLSNGVLRTETESFLLLDDSYIRTLVLKDCGTGRHLIAQVEDEHPMTRAQYEVFTGLLPWVGDTK